MRKLILLLVFVGTVLTVKAQNITGSWSGKLKAGNNTLTVVFNMKKSDGILKSTMDSPDQGVMGIKIDKTSFVNNELNLNANTYKIFYTGKLNDKADTIKGTFKQGMASFPLVLTRHTIKKITRKQDPVSFNYKVEDVIFKNKRDNINLAGTLTLPKDKKIKYAAILISGSGAQNRDEELFNHRPFMIWADWLTKQGIAVLRYDDRGVAESEGNFSGSTTADFSYDAEAAFNYLKSRKELKHAKIGFIGHSEGGMVAPMVAARNNNIDFAVLLAGPGVPIEKLLIQQKRDMSKLRGVPADYIEKELSLTNKILVYLSNNADVKEESKFKDGLEKVISKELNEKLPEMNADVKKLVAVYSGKWFRFFASFNPDKYLSKVECPVLAINGSLDCQVKSSDNLKAIDKSLTVAGNKNFKTVELEGLNHMLQKAKTGIDLEYRQIEETVNQEALNTVSEWITNLN